MANRPAVERRAARAAVATGAPFGGWRLLAQAGTSAGAASPGIGTPSTSYGSEPSTGSSNGMNGSNGTNGPSGSNGTNGTNSGAPDYGPTGAAGGMTVPGATPTATPGTSLPVAPSTSVPSTSVPSTTPSTSPSAAPNVGAPNPPSSTSVPSFGGGTTQ